MAGTLFNFGPLEIITVVALTLILLGPERLPKLFRQFGEGIRKFRNYYLVLAEQIRKELEPVSEDLGEIRQVVRDLQSDLSDIRNAVDLRSMLPPVNVSEELNAGAPTISAPPNIYGSPPDASLNGSSHGATPDASLNGSSYGATYANQVGSTTLISGTPDANLGTDNPWSGSEEPIISTPPQRSAAVLAEDSPWLN